MFVSHDNLTEHIEKSSLKRICKIIVQHFPCQAIVYTKISLVLTVPYEEIPGMNVTRTSSQQSLSIYLHVNCAYYYLDITLFI